MVLWPLIHVKCRMDPWALSGIHPLSPFSPGEDVKSRRWCGLRGVWAETETEGYTREEPCYSAPSFMFSLESICYRFLLAAEHHQCRFIPVLTPYSVRSQASLAHPGLPLSRCWTMGTVRLICLPGQRWGMLRMCRALRRWNHSAELQGESSDTVVHPVIP